MNYKRYIKLAKQVYKIAYKLPRLPLPDKIEKEALECYYDFVNNDGKNGKIKQIKVLQNLKQIGAEYIIKNIKDKSSDWQYVQSMKNRFNDEIILNFVENKYNLYSQTSTQHHIIIMVDYDYSDKDDLTHQLQHYFEHEIIDEQLLQHYIEQQKNLEYIESYYQRIKKYLSNKGQRVQQIGTCCKRFFDLYMKSCYKEMSFQQFYNKYIERLTDLSIEKLKTRRYQLKYQNSIEFLNIIKQQNQNEYNKIKEQIIEYANESIKQRQNIQKVIESKNYSLMQQLILDNKQDKKFIDIVINILIENKKFKLLTEIIDNLELIELIDENIKSQHLLSLLRFSNNIEILEKTIDIIIKRKQLMSIHTAANIVNSLNINKLIKQRLLNKLQNWFNYV